MFQVNLAGREAHAGVLPGHAGAGRGKVVNNASISGYADPAAWTYAAARPASSRSANRSARELRGTGRVGAAPGHAERRDRHVGRHRQVYGGHIGYLGWQLSARGMGGRRRAAIRSRSKRARTGRAAGAREACIARSRVPARPHLRRDVQPRRRVARLGQQHLHVEDAPLRKPRLAPGEVEVPQSAEALVVAERRPASPAAPEALRQARSVPRSPRVMSSSPSVACRCARASSARSPRIEGRQPPGNRACSRSCAPPSRRS